jgi:hypothetical protein
MDACSHRPGKSTIPSMAFIFMPNPVCLSLKRLWLFAHLISARKWLHVFVKVLRPVRWFLKLLGLEAKLAFKFCWKISNRGHGTSLGKASYVALPSSGQSSEKLVASARSAVALPPRQC